jgi:hypothetical protein
MAPSLISVRAATGENLLQSASAIRAQIKIKHQRSPSGLCADQGTSTPDTRRRIGTACRPSGTRYIDTLLAALALLRTRVLVEPVPCPVSRRRLFLLHRPALHHAAESLLHACPWPQALCTLPSAHRTHIGNIGFAGSNRRRLGR